MIALSAALAFAQSKPKETKMSLKVTSSAFTQGSEIPKQFTCRGEDRSPALSWSGAPAGTKSLALIADDPDAPMGTWTHWVLWSLPATATSLPDAVEKKAQLSDGAFQGTNSFKNLGYGGPCPPPGKPHRYFFKLYALDQKLELPAGATKGELEEAIKGHILARGELMGTFRR